MAKRSRRAKTRGPQAGGMNMGMMQQQMAQLQAQMTIAQDALADETVTASAGGGVVTSTVTGDQRVQSIEIAPDIFEDGDVEMLQDLIMTAINSALDQSRELAAERLGPLASGLPF